MSADNAIYILRSKSEWNTDGIYRYKVPEHFIYRAAHAQGMDNYHWYKENQEYNLGWYLSTVFKNCYRHRSLESALYEARSLEQAYGYTEYGISVIEFDKTFPGD